MKLRAGEWIVLGGSAAIAAFAALVGAIIYLKPPPVRYTYLESPRTLAGEALYRQAGCGACHKIFGNGAAIGPALDGVGSRRSGEWLADFLSRAHKGTNPLPPDERAALVTYLEALRSISNE
jgi:cytochrome c2